MSAGNTPLNPLLVAKIALVAGGLATFGVGIRVGNAAIRWVGIGIVAIAWLLRFAKRPRPLDEGVHHDGGTSA